MIPRRIAQRGRAYGFSHHQAACAMVNEVWFAWAESRSWTSFCIISGQGFTGKKSSDKIKPTIVTNSKEAMKEYENLFQSMIVIGPLDDPVSNKRF